MRERKESRMTPRDGGIRKKCRIDLRGKKKDFLLGLVKVKMLISYSSGELK